MRNRVFLLVTLESFSFTYSRKRHIYVLLHSFLSTESLTNLSCSHFSCRDLSIFHGCKTKLKRPVKASANFKSFRVIERKIWQINFSFLLRVESGGKKTRKYLGGWEKLGSNQKTFFSSVTKIKTLTSFFDLMISGGKSYCNFSASQCCQ